MASLTGSYGGHSIQVIFCACFERTLIAAGRELNFSKKTWRAFCGIHIIRELWWLTSIFLNKLLCLSHCHNLNPVSWPLHYITWRNITLYNRKKLGAQQMYSNTAASFCNLIWFKSATDRPWPSLVAFMSSQRTWFQRQLSIKSSLPLPYLHSVPPPPKTVEESGSWQPFIHHGEQTAKTAQQATSWGMTTAMDKLNNSTSTSLAC